MHSGALVLQLLSPCTATTEACAPRARALQQREATAMRRPHTTTKSSPSSLQLEKARAQQQRSSTDKKPKKQKNPDRAIVNTGGHVYALQLCFQAAGLDSDSL